MWPFTKKPIPKERPLRLSLADARVVCRRNRAGVWRLVHTTIAKCIEIDPASGWAQCARQIDTVLQALEDTEWQDDE